MDVWVVPCSSCSGLDRGFLMDVGPERAGDLGLRAEVDWTWIGPKRARAQLRGRPISEKALVILECKEAFAKTVLSPLNAIAHLPGPLGERHIRKNPQAG